MSELAFNANGDNFEVIATVTGWRVRRMKPRGAPELVYGRDGCPLVIPISSNMDDLREAVGALGRYRLDPVNDDGVVVEGVPAAYVQVFKPERVAAPVEAVRDDGDSVLREAMRLNTELAKSVIDRFPEMMTAAAELLRAADGAGLPARLPRLVELDTSDDEDEDEQVMQSELVIAPGASPFDLNKIVADVVATVVKSFMTGNVKIPGLAAMFDWRKASPANATKETDKTTTEEPRSTAEKPKTKPTTKPTTEPQPAAMPPLDLATMAHVIAIQSALTPEEVAFVQEVAKELSPAEQRGWFDKLGKLSVPDAVATIRDLIAGNGKTGGAS